MGGTSVATPALAGVVNAAGGFAPSTNVELLTIYGNRKFSAEYEDTKQGYCGPYAGYAAIVGWDFCTGVGVPLGYKDKQPLPLRVGIKV